MPNMPKFKPANVGALQDQAIGYDREAYALSDADFLARNPQLVEAQNLFKDRVLSDFTTSSVPSRALHDEMMRAGIANAAGAFGGTIAPGSAGEASVARHLGLGVMDLANQNRANQNQSMGMASQLFQPRTFGFGGQGALQLELANLEGQNAWNQANYASQVAGGQYNSGIAAQNQNAKIQSSNNNMAAIGSAASAAAVGAVAVCWVAIEAFGESSDKWRRFREVMIDRLPASFIRLYLRNGRKVASMISSSETAKLFTRFAMACIMALYADPNTEANGAA